MKAIRWRRGRYPSERRATVEGVRLALSRAEAAGRLFVFAGPKLVLELPEDATRMQIDAAAYALADLVATLKGFA